MSVDEIKDMVLDTCKSPLQMDIAQMRRGLEKWGFKIEDFELLNDPNPGVLREHMIWLTCQYGVELARTNFTNWLTGLKDFPWIGRWDYVVKYARFHRHGKAFDPSAEFTVAVTRFSGGVFSVSGGGIHAKMPWPDRRREIVDETKWQRPYLT